ncbi:MAG: hypothetical protein PHT88_00460 [Candidatus Moranbacteria bacterium]|nr:hypothetical protein [Candidatus Moranbacteria bacterium]
MNTQRIIIICVGVAAAGFAYYAISPLFRNVRVDEPYRCLLPKAHRHH